MGFIAGSALVTSDTIDDTDVEFLTFGPFEVGVVIRSFNVVYAGASNNTELLIRPGIFQAPPISDAAHAAGHQIWKVNPGAVNLIFRMGTQVFSSSPQLWLGWRIESPARFLCFRCEADVGTVRMVLSVDAAFEGFYSHTPLASNR